MVPPEALWEAEFALVTVSLTSCLLGLLSGILMRLPCPLSPSLFSEHTLCSETRWELGGQLIW